MLVRKFLERKHIRHETKAFSDLSLTITALSLVGCKKDNTDPDDDDNDTINTFTIRHMLTTIHRYHHGQAETSGTWPTFMTPRLPFTRDITTCTVPMPRMVMLQKGMVIFRASVQAIW
jgi:hypothetical protein